MVIRVIVHCDNNGGAHFAELSVWDIADPETQQHARDTFDDLMYELNKQAASQGWLLIPAEHKGWTRVLCNKCCAGQGGQDG